MSFSDHQISGHDPSWGDSESETWTGYLRDGGWTPYTPTSSDAHSPSVMTLEIKTRPFFSKRVYKILNSTLEITLFSLSSHFRKRMEGEEYQTLGQDPPFFLSPVLSHRRHQEGPYPWSLGAHRTTICLRPGGVW